MDLLTGFIKVVAKYVIIFRNAFIIDYDFCKLVVDEQYKLYKHNTVIIFFISLKLLLFFFYKVFIYMGDYLYFIKMNNNKHVYILSMYSSSFVLAISIFFWLSNICPYIINVIYSNFLTQILFYLDDISWLFIILTSFLILLSLFTFFDTYNGIKYRRFFFIVLLLLLAILLVIVPSVTDLLSFYIFFEATLIPMFLIIGIWGSRQRKIHAAYMFFLYTSIGSVFFLISIFILLNNFYVLGNEILVLSHTTAYSEKIIWFLLFIGLCVKIPMFPFHIWSPEAHVEAPTIGSVIPAGILLKLGTYGMLRYLVPIFPIGNLFFYPFIMVLCLLAIIYVSYITISQIDSKKIIAYASISHMAYVIPGLFSSNIISVVGSIYLMISHGSVSGGLFYSIGCLYHRYHTRILTYYGGLLLFMPIFTCLLFLFILGNISFPGTSNFTGEFLIFIGIINDNMLLGVIALFRILPGSIYSIWLFNRLISGFIKSKSIIYFSEISLNEFIILFFLCILILFLGIWPSIILERLEYWCFPLMEIRLASIHTNVLSTNFVCDSQTDIISIYFNSLNDFISYGRKNILIFIKSDFITDIIFYMGIHLYDFAKTTRTIILMGSLMLPIKFDYNTKIEVTVSPSRRNISGTMVPISRELFPTHTGHPISSWRPPMHTGHLGPTWRPPMNTGHPAPTWRPPMHTGHFPVKSVGDNKKDWQRKLWEEEDPRHKVTFILHITDRQFRAFWDHKWEWFKWILLKLFGKLPCIVVWYDGYRKRRDQAEEAEEAKQREERMKKRREIAEEDRQLLIWRIKIEREAEETRALIAKYKLEGAVKYDTGIKTGVQTKTEQGSKTKTDVQNKRNDR